MYSLIIVSRCKKKAKENTRKILDSYGMRIGSKTWSAKISEIGKKALISKLVSIASKNSSILIYNGKNNELLIEIGSKKHTFNDQTAIKTSKIKKYTINNLYKKIIKTAAYFHDVGKAHDSFQLFLHGNTEMDKEKTAIKHEFLSYLITESFLNDQEFNYTIPLNKIEIDLNELDFTKIVQLLILQHHKMTERKNEILILPGGEGQNIKRNLIGSNYSLGTRSSKENVAKVNYSLEEYMNLKKKFLSSIQDIEKIALQLNFEISYEAFEYITQISRLCIMTADHNVSSLVSENTNDDEENSLLAKTKSHGYQSLFNHLQDVENESCNIFDMITKHSPVSLTKESVSKLMQKSIDNNFKWQDEAVSQINKNHKKGNGLFAVISSSTGSGKTLGVAKMCLSAQLKHEECLRYTTVLGLKNLTLQTGSDYKNLIDSDQILTQIGSKATLEINRQNEKESYGDDEEDLGENPVCISTDNVVTSVAHSVFGDKSGIQSDYISAPVVVSTIDYIVSGADFRKSNFIFSQLRIMNSDVILDEVDGYDLNDLLTIVRLCYVVGLYGRRVYLSTATPNKKLINSLFEAYSLGYNAFLKANMVDGEIDSFIISNYTIDDNILCSFASLSDVDSFTSFFQESFLEKIPFLKSKKLRNIAVEDINIDNMLQKAIQLHFDNYESKDGVNMSAGMIRVAHIKSGFKLYQKIERFKREYEEANSKTKVNLVFYHSQMWLATRSFLEKSMDLGLKRKNLPLEESILFRKDFHSNKFDNIINIFIVTPVEEVGRDHDFNWAIIEPSSLRSIIQTAGRVNRHRQIDYSNREPNIILMNENFQLQSPWVNPSQPVYRFPGYETEDDVFMHNGQRHMNALSSYDNQIIDFTPFDILSPKCPLAEQELAVIENHFNNYMNVFKKTAAKMVLSEYIGSKTKIHSCGVFTNFRDGNKSNSLVFKYIEEKESLYSKQGENFSIHLGSNSKANTHVKDYDFDFIDMNFQEYIKNLKEKIDEDALWSVKISSSIGIKGCFYNQFLGVIKSPKGQL